MRFSKGCPVARLWSLKLEEPPNNRWQLFITWLLDSLTKGVPVVSTVGASSRKSPASIWRGVVFVAFVVGMMAMGRGAWAFSCSDVTEIPNTECEALVDFYNSTNGANWKNNTGWNDTNTPCSWHGVSCSDGHVTKIDFNFNQLSGSIPKSFSNLSNLQYLNMCNNQLNGPIPESLGNLSNLQELILCGNQLSGSIPESLGNLSNLQNLSLDGNQLSGSIPESLGNLSNLQTIGLSYNQLSGSIPESLGNLSNLQNLVLYDNQLSGSIPESLSKLSKLQYLSLYNNKLEGSIPELLGNLSSLQFLILHGNKFSGSIPELLGNLSSLQFLILHGNKFSGSIPEWLSKLSNLQTLTLHDNNFSGSIPEWLSELKNLKHLSLGNKHSGSIPEWFSNLSNLQSLVLLNNELCGDIPLSLMELDNLTYLSLNNNHLTASDPELIAWLDKIEQGADPYITTFLNIEDPNWRNQTPCPAPKLATTVPPSICNGDSFDVTFQTVMTESQSVDTVTINLGFDPAVLQINSLTNSGVLDFEMVNNHDNGSIDFTAGVWGNPVPTQTFDMFTVNFTALQATETTLTYDTSKSSLVSEGVSIPYIVEDGQLTVSNCFNYQVDLQRQTPKPDSSWETALEISIGTQTSATQYTDTCDENGQGNIALEGALGNEDYICVKNAHTLANKVEAPIDINNIVDFGLLLEGDANGDNDLTIKDFSLVVTAKKSGTYNPNADFDVNGSIEMSDALLLKANMGKTSACTWNADLGMLRKGVRDGAGTVTLNTTVIPTGLMVEESFEYTVNVQAGTQLVDTASAYLNFDPQQLQVNNLIAGDKFDFVLQEEFDNTNGHINFAAGVWNNDVPTGTFTLVTVNMTVLQAGGEKTLSFNTTNPRQTEAVSGGKSAVSEQRGAEVVFDDKITVAPASCQLYAVNDKGLNNSQFFTVNLDDLTISELGPMYNGHDIEALAIHPETDMIYAASGDNVTTGEKGHLYRVDGETGELFPIGSTGFKEIEDLTFSPDGTLYAWAKGDGLITIGLATGTGTLVIPYKKPLIEGLTLKKNVGNIFFGAVGTDLWQYDKDTDTLNVICADKLLGETEALEIMPNGLLLIGTHNVPFGLHAFDVQTCQIIEADETLSNQYDDVEGITLPVAACSVP